MDVVGGGLPLRYADVPAEHLVSGLLGLYVIGSPLCQLELVVSVGTGGGGVRMVAHHVADGDVHVGDDASPGLFLGVSPDDRPVLSAILFKLEIETIPFPFRDDQFLGL